MVRTQHIKAIVEAILFASHEPVSLNRLRDIIEEVDRQTLKLIISELQNEYILRGSGLQIVEIAGGFQMATRSELGEYIRRLKKTRHSSRLSRPSLETLAIIAYKQPVMKHEIDEIRGVDSAGVIKGLLQKRLIKIVGRKDEPGRPILYGTTKEFLRHFGLRNLSELPTLRDLEASGILTQSTNADYHEREQGIQEN